MTAPIYGPFPKSLDFHTYYRVRQLYKQKAPYTDVAPYVSYGSYREYARGVNFNPGPARGYTFVTSFVKGTPNYNQARIQAYEKLKASITDTASMGENLVDINQSVKTITTRATQLFRFTNAVKHGRFKDAADILQTPGPRKLHPIKQSANNWLEYHLGIEPVVKDIWSAMDIIQKPMKPHKVRVRASGSEWRENLQRTGPQASTDKRVQIRVQYECEVAVSNPVLYLANSLGILNPVQVLWQVIPLSFVLDWFANVEQFFGTATDFWGITTQNAATTTTWQGTWEENWYYYGWYSQFKSGGISRDLGISLPSLGLRPLKALGWKRGLTAVALLTNSLRSLDTQGYRADKRKLVFRNFDRNIQGRLTPNYDWLHEPRRRGD